MGKALELVNEFYETSFKRKDNEGVRSLIEDDFLFVGPMAQTKGGDAFVELNSQFLPAFAGSRMLQQFENEDEVCSIYELDLHTPAGGSITLKVADWVKLRGERLAEQRIYYDAREFEQEMAPPGSA